MRNKILGVFLVLITIPFIILTIFTITFTNLKNPLFYKQVLDKHSIYNSATLSIRSLPVASDSNNFFSAVIPQITTSWLKENVETNLDNFNVYLKGKNSTYDFYLNIAPFKAQIVKNMPGLSANDIPDKLTLSSYSQILEKLQANQTGLVKNSDTGSDVGSQIEKNINLQDQFSKNTSQVKKGIGYFNIGSWVVIGLALVLLILIGVAARRNLKSMFRWLAATLLISVGLMILPTFFINKFGSSYVTKISSKSLTPQTMDLIKNSIKAVSFELAHIILILCAVIGGIGLLFIIISFFVPAPPKEIKPKDIEKAPPGKITEVRDVS